MEQKRVTIRIPLETWKALRNLQTEGKIESIQQVAVSSMNTLIESLNNKDKKETNNRKGMAKKRVLNALIKEKPLGSWKGIHQERTESDADRS